MLDTVVWLTRNIHAMVCCDNLPDEYNLLISTTSTSVSFASPLSLPRLLSELFLRLAALSLLLSSLVPRNRCAGLTHVLLSHVCNTHMSVGMLPTNSAYAALCATTMRFLSGSQNDPYPLASLPAVHSQHSSGDGAETFVQKLLHCLSDVIIRILYHETYGNV